MNTVSTILVIVIIAVIAVGAYYFFVMPYSQVPAASSNTGTATNTSGTTGAAPFMPAPIVFISSSSANPSLGMFLVAQNDMTLYRYTEDTSNTSNCSGQCAMFWPPYLVSSSMQIVAPAGATGILGTTMRADGSLQVTYNEMPLYFYYKDVNPGDTTGQNVEKTWFVVSP